MIPETLFLCVNRWLLLCFLLATLFFTKDAMCSQTASLNIDVDAPHFQYPRPIIIPVRVFAPEPVENARVWGELTAPSGKKEPLTFIQVIYDPISLGLTYQAVIKFVAEDGVFNLTVWADDNQGQAAFAQGLEDDPQPGKNSGEGYTNRSVPSFGPVSATISLTLTGYAKGGSQMPAKIYDFNLQRPQSGCIDFFFRAPLNVEADDTYEIRYSTAFINSEAVWSQSKIGETGSYTKGGTLVQGKICGLKSGFFHVAVRSKTRQGLVSEISNNYSVAIP